VVSVTDPYATGYKEFEYLKNSNLRNIMQRSLLLYQRFAETYCVHLQDRNVIKGRGKDSVFSRKFYSNESKELFD
jgi:hypothetical protein